MPRHPQGPFTVIVQTYRLSPVVDTRPCGAVYISRHRSPAAAARRLATIIACRTPLARDVRACIPRDHAGRYQITNGAGERFALVPFRVAYPPC